MFSSKLFVFVIGENQSEFLVHAGIIAKQSKALDALINGPMAEASRGKAILDDVQADTFERFCQFAYAGNYTTPTYKSVELPSSIDKSKHVEIALDPETDSESVAVKEPEADQFGIQSSKKLKKPSKFCLKKL